MWQKPLVIIILLYFFVLLQNSFFVHFSFFGSMPNLVFIYFFLLAFFLKKDKNYQIVYLSAIAGALLDVYSYTYLGPSIIILLALGFLLKKTQAMLKNKGDNFPFSYFLPLFLVFFVSYEILLTFYLKFFDLSSFLMSFDVRFLAGVVYNLLFASIFFYIYKKCQKFTR